MSQLTLLKIANTSMLFTFTAFVVSALLAYGFESHFPLMVITILHVAQMFLAGFFKVSYVIRLVAQSQLGQVLR